MAALGPGLELVLDIIDLLRIIWILYISIDVLKLINLDVLIPHHLCPQMRCEDFYFFKFSLIFLYVLK